MSDRYDELALTWYEENGGRMARSAETVEEYLYHLAAHFRPATDPKPSTPPTPATDGLSPQAMEFLRIGVQWMDSYAEVNNLHGKVEWVERARKLLANLPDTGNQLAPSGQLETKLRELSATLRYPNAPQTFEESHRLDLQNGLPEEAEVNWATLQTSREIADKLDSILESAGGPSPLETKLRDALQTAAVRLQICHGRMAGCPAGHELIDEVQMFVDEARAALSAADAGSGKEGEIVSRRVEKLADELFESVQQSQGFSFVSDGEAHDGMTEEQFFERVRGRLQWSHESVRLMRNFLRKYKQWPKGRHGK
jgi:hypothetical protein